MKRVVEGDGRKYIAYKGDCMEVMKGLEDESVDLILTDPPYGTIKGLSIPGRDGERTNKKNDWDEVVDVEAMLAEFERVLKPRGRAIIFGNNQYTLEVRNASTSKFRYTYPLYWVKNTFGNPMGAKVAPLSYVEDISVFMKTYSSSGKKRLPKATYNLPEGKNHVSNVFEVAKDAYGRNAIHPTQKPLELMRQLVYLFSNENDVVLDAFMGSGSTGEACISAGRNFIGIELDDEYYEAAHWRLRKYNSRINK